MEGEGKGVDPGKGKGEPDMPTQKNIGLKRKLSFVEDEKGKQQRVSKSCLEIHHINLRCHGDVTVIAIKDEVGNYIHKTLIDGGLNSKDDSKFLAYIENVFGNNTNRVKFDNVILTHYHADHFGGLEGIGNPISENAFAFTTDYLLDLGGHRTNFVKTDIQELQDTTKDILLKTCEPTLREDSFKNSSEQEVQDILDYNLAIDNAIRENFKKINLQDIFQTYLTGRLGNIANPSQRDDNVEIRQRLEKLKAQDMLSNSNKLLLYIFENNLDQQFDRLRLDCSTSTNFDPNKTDITKKISPMMKLLQANKLTNNFINSIIGKFNEFYNPSSKLPGCTSKSLSTLLRESANRKFLSTLAEKETSIEKDEPSDDDIPEERKESQSLLPIVQQKLLENNIDDEDFIDIDTIDIDGKEDDEGVIDIEGDGSDGEAMDVETTINPNGSDINPVSIDDKTKSNTVDVKSDPKTINTTDPGNDLINFSKLIYTALESFGNSIFKHLVEIYYAKDVKVQKYKPYKSNKDSLNTLTNDILEKYFLFKDIENIGNKKTKSVSQIFQNKIKEKEEPKFIDKLNNDNFTNWLKIGPGKEANTFKAKCYEALQTDVQAICAAIQNSLATFDTPPQLSPTNFNERIPQGEEGQNTNKGNESTKMRDYMRSYQKLADAKRGIKGSPNTDNLQIIGSSETLGGNDDKKVSAAFAKDIGKQITLGEIEKSGEKIPVTLRLVAANGYVWNGETANNEKGNCIPQSMKLDNELLAETIEIHNWRIEIIDSMQKFITNKILTSTKLKDEELTDQSREALAKFQEIQSYIFQVKSNLHINDDASLNQKLTELLENYKKDLAEVNNNKDAYEKKVKDAAKKNNEDNESKGEGVIKENGFKRFIHTQQTKDAHFDTIATDRIEKKIVIESINSNNASLGFLIEFGAFRYYTGGDIGGINFTTDSYGQTGYVDHETALAIGFRNYYKSVKTFEGEDIDNNTRGHVCSMKLNHHGSEKSSNIRFLSTLKPTAVFNSSHVLHRRFPSIRALGRLHSYPKLYDKQTQGFFFSSLFDFAKTSGDGYKQSRTFAVNTFTNRPETVFEFGNAKDQVQIMGTNYKPVDEYSNYIIQVDATDIKSKSSFKVLKSNEKYDYEIKPYEFSCHSNIDNAMDAQIPDEEKITVPGDILKKFEVIKPYILGELEGEKEVEIQENSSINSAQSGTNFSVNYKLLPNRGADESIINNSRKRTYWYSWEDGFNLLKVIRKYNFTYNLDDIPNVGEEYSMYRENASKTLITDPYYCISIGLNKFASSFDTSFADDLSKIKWNPNTIIIPLLCTYTFDDWQESGDVLKKKVTDFLSKMDRGGHWISLKIQLNYLDQTVTLLWNDPIGTSRIDLSNSLTKKIVDTITDKFFKKDIRVTTLHKTFCQQKNHYDCGPITFSNIEDYAGNNNLGVLMFGGMNGVNYTLGIDDSSNTSDDARRLVRAKHMLYYYISKSDGLTILPNNGNKSMNTKDQFQNLLKLDVRDSSNIYLDVISKNSAAEKNNILNNIFEMIEKINFDPLNYDMTELLNIKVEKQYNYDLKA
jgi:hypothetical protein